MLLSGFLIYINRKKSENFRPLHYLLSQYCNEMSWTGICFDFLLFTFIAFILVHTLISIPYWQNCSFEEKPKNIFRHVSSAHNSELVFHNSI